VCARAMMTARAMRTAPIASRMTTPAAPLSPPPLQFPLPLQLQSLWLRDPQSPRPPHPHARLDVAVKQASQGALLRKWKDREA